MLLLGVDLETTGLDTQNDDIIEVGAVVWDTERKAPVKMYSNLVKTNIPLKNEIVELTGIHEADISNWGVSLEEAISSFFEISKKCQYIVAHNGKEFDKKFFDRAFKSFPQYQVNLNWIDTMTDLPYPSSIKTRKLTHLASDHNFLNPFSHRSLFDVLTMMKVFSNYPIDQVLEFANSPLVKVIAHVSFDEKDKAKALGFRWDSNRKIWYSGMREALLNQTEFPFPTSCEAI